MYQKTIGYVLYAALGAQPGIIHTITVLGQYTSQLSTLPCENIKHMLRSHCGSSEYKLMIYDTRLQYNSNSITWYVNADLETEADSTKSTSGIIIFVLGILVLWRSMKLT
jgi:hypothetical protein